MSHVIPQGYRFAGVHCGVKKKPGKLDCSLIVSDVPATAAGVYTQNRIFAAPVALDRQRTPGESLRGVVVNSGNANACTGSRGFDDAVRMAELAGEAIGADGKQMLVMSTGVIGNFLPLEKIAAGLKACGQQLASDEDHLVAAAQAFMTTDTVHKIASRKASLSGREVRILGICKGAAMIGPNMATMLAVVLTDAPLSKANAQWALKQAVDESFNAISVDGHVSTNDTVLLLANGLAGGEPMDGPDLGAFRSQLGAVCAELARAIVNDGEGTTHVVTIDVEGCANVDDARAIAKTVANSPLVKTAIAGADANWGRIVSAAGYAEVAFDPDKVSLWVHGVQLYENGAPKEYDDPAVSKLIKENRECPVRLVFGEGTAKARFWTTDLTAEYVRLNADYRT